MIANRPEVFAALANRFCFVTLAGTIRAVTLRLGNCFNEFSSVNNDLIDEGVINVRCLTPEEVRELVTGKPRAR